MQLRKDEGIMVPVKCQKCGATVQSKEDWSGHCPKNLNDEGKSIGHGLLETDMIQFLGPEEARMRKIMMETPRPDTCAWCMAIGNGLVPGLPTLGRGYDSKRGGILDAAFCEQYGHRGRLQAIYGKPEYAFSMERIKAWLDANCQPDPEVFFKA